MKEARSLPFRPGGPGFFPDQRLDSGEDSWFEYVKLNIRPR
jgi:hypothetical protein